MTLQCEKDNRRQREMARPQKAQFLTEVSDLFGHRHRKGHDAGADGDLRDIIEGAPGVVLAPLTASAL